MALFPQTCPLHNTDFCISEEQTCTGCELATWLRVKCLNCGTEVLEPLEEYPVTSKLYGYGYRRSNTFGYCDAVCMETYLNS